MIDERFAVEFDEISALLKKSRRILILGHVDPDGDCLGSMFSLALYLESTGREVKCFAPGDIPELFLTLPGAGSFAGLDDVERFDHDTIIALDSPTVERTQNLVRSGNGETIINIDHHPVNQRYGRVNIVDEKAAATTILVYRMLRRISPESITPQIADCLYLGILMDTGGFRFQNTNGEALTIAGALIESGADAYRLAHDFIFMKKFRTLKLLAPVLESLELHVEGRIAMMEVTLDMLERTGAELSDSEGFVDYGVAIDDVELVALLREIGPKEIRISLRSKSDLDVAVLAGKYGGGGHRKAAGLTIRKDLEAVRSIILEGFREMLDRR